MSDEKQCPHCKSKRGYTCEFKSQGDCVVNNRGDWMKDTITNIYETHGPYVCLECGMEIDREKIFN